MALDPSQEEASSTTGRAKRFNLETLQGYLQKYADEIDDFVTKWADLKCIHEPEKLCRDLCEQIRNACLEGDSIGDMPGDERIKFESQVDAIVNSILSWYFASYRGFRVCPQWSFRPLTANQDALKDMQEWSGEAQADSSISELDTFDFEKDLGFMITSTPYRQRDPVSANSSLSTIENHPSTSHTGSLISVDPPASWSRLRKYTDTPSSLAQLASQLPQGKRPSSVRLIFDSNGRPVDPAARIAGRPDFIVSLKISREESIIIIIVEDKLQHKTASERQLRNYMAQLGSSELPPLGMTFVMTKKGLHVSLFQRQNEAIQQLQDDDGWVWHSPTDDFVHKQIVRVMEEALEYRHKKGNCSM
ncbi:hypothetical protein VKT23_020585 [Stygiomarasmius scandens]|uniref:Uncharacterized protein n=1 Tax=Marasmiellus scandens TaxID=2682957 RepID=A0ABR1ILF9_9AGAR